MPGVRDAAGEETDGEHGQVYLPGVPEAVGKGDGQTGKHNCRRTKPAGYALVVRQTWFMVEHGEWLACWYVCKL